MSFKPWTKRFEVSWPQTLRFFEHRYSILGELEERGALRQILVQENRVSARLGDATEVLAFGFTGLEK